VKDQDLGESYFLPPSRCLTLLFLLNEPVGYLPTLPSYLPRALPTTYPAHFSLNPQTHLEAGPSDKIFTVYILHHLQIFPAKSLNSPALFFVQLEIVSYA